MKPIQDFIAVLVTCIQPKMKALEWSQDFPIITLWELSVAMETRILILFGPKPKAAFPQSQ